jgi:DNA-binding PadR family transcriptional regulator
MQRNRPLSPQAMTLMLALADRSTTWRHGYDLGQETGLKAGSLYPILMRLADRGWLEAKWETEVPAGRPPRHLYRLTATGREELRKLARAKSAAERLRPKRMRPRPEGT